jgi:hypothetical protein
MRRLRRHGGLLAVSLCVVVAVSAGIVVVNSHRATGGQSSSLFYLAIGASASLGVQPTGVPAHNGAFTTEGYGDDVVRLEAAQGRTVTLEKIGCMGETAQSMAGVGDHCYKRPSTQLSTAVDFLRAHHSDSGLVSIDIGFNNVRRCLWVVPLATQCANQGIAAVRLNMPTVLRKLKAAAGPHVHFVGLNYADPFLYRYVKGGPGPSRAQQSLTIMTHLNRALVTAYRSAGVSVADVAARFKSSDTAPTTLARFGTVPTNVAEVCQLTWMCAARPFGPDDHPNKTGYMVIAQTIVAALPSQF